ncbi:MAG TPA: nucleoside-diphosphate sugar epimerase/dehydratase [Spirochaetota bacterium]|nr:nucleoside-diphosphate sugar epimerase/dehydratase [Spirochaetota bacterium]
MKNLLIIGAGEAGKMVSHDILVNKNLSNKYHLVGFIDDDPNKKSVDSVNVIGQIKDSSAVIKEYNIDEVIIAIPSATKDLINKILNALQNTNVVVKIVPGFYEIIEGKVVYNQIRNIEPSDLLGREEVGFDLDKISDYYKDKIIFVTGAGGSIGSQIFFELFELPVKKVIAFGHGENSIHNLITKIGNDKRFYYVIGDVRDKNKVNHEIERFKPDIIFHVAAHKHVPLMEDYPDEAVKNNIFGTYNVAKAAIQHKVKKFIFVSTDKAVNPTSVMGATKRLSEKITLSFNKIQNTTKFQLTRFGNVLGSRGSVIPIFKEQIEKGGPITITHKDMTRFFMSIREAARLVIKSGSIQSGNIFILDMGQPVKIVDLAKNLIKLYGYNENDIPIIFTGVRAGEKLYEEILTKKENLKKSIFEKLFISNEEDSFYNENEIEKILINLETTIEKYDNIEIKKLLKKYNQEYQF